jgi:hypothetical protein
MPLMPQKKHRYTHAQKKIAEDGREIGLFWERALVA